MIVQPPPRIDQIPAFTQLVAGLGVSTVLPDADFETYSEAGFIWDDTEQKWGKPPGAPKSSKGLGIVGAAAYAMHPTTEVLSFKYNLKDGVGVRWWKPGLPNPTDLFDYLARGGLVEAWNSGFEWWIWNCVCVPKYGWPPLAIESLRCAMAKSRAHGYPGKLEIAGDVMGLQYRKDKRGGKLLDKFSFPRNPTKKDPRRRIRPEEDPEGPELYEYNGMDILSEAEASSHCPDLQPFELDFWLADQRINRRGVQMDTVAIHNCAVLVQQVLRRYDSELYWLTGQTVETTAQLEKLKGWLGARGVHTNSLDEDSCDELLKIPGLDPHARRAIELRQLCGSASVKKVFAMRNQVSLLQRLHDLFNYHAARTGRATGADVQAQNLPKNGPAVYRCGWTKSGDDWGHTSRGCGRFFGEHRPTCAWCGQVRLPRPADKWCPEAVEDALEVIAWGSLDLLEAFFGDAMLTIAGCLRGLFIAAPGHELLCSDYSNIEGVVAAALSGEEWRLEVFRTHGKLYEMSACKITGMQLEDMLAYKKANGRHHPDRNGLGKFAELGSGFGGWINAWKNFGAGDHMSDDEIKTALLAWRAASPNIVEMWGGQERKRGYDNYVQEYYGLEGMAIQAVLNPGREFSYRGIKYRMHGDALYCTLLSGRHLVYHHPRLQAADAPRRGLSFSYEGYNTNPKMGPIGWSTMWAYGGKFFENVVQATARDILAFAIVNLEKAGFPVVLHVHDEVVCEVLIGSGRTVQMVEAIMATLPWWCQGWPIKAAGGWVGFRYRKAD